MAVLPDPNKNFINALSDFWVTYFQDIGQVKALNTGVELAIGQSYLTLLETVLGTSLKFMPLFSKRYYELFVIGEDELLFREGSAVTDDRYTYSTPTLIQAVPVLQSRVISPTAFLEDRADYEVTPGEIAFKNDLFVTLPLFPLRTIQKVFASTYKEPVGRLWPGVKVGDLFRYQRANSVPRTSLITGNRETTLLLDQFYPEFTEPTSVKSWRVDILRTPFDAQQTSVALTNQVSTVSRMSENPTDGVLVAGTKNVEFSGEPYYKGAWVAGTPYLAGELVTQAGALYRAREDHTSGTFTLADWIDFAGYYLSIHCPANPSNNGMFLVAGIGPTILQLDRPAVFETASDLSVQIHLVNYEQTTASRPMVNLGHGFIDPGLVLTGRRAQDVYQIQPDGSTEVFLSGGSVIEGVDYAVDYVTGDIVYLSAWDPFLTARATYTWKYQLLSYSYAVRGAWANATAYVIGDIVTSAGKTYVCSVAHTSSGAINLNNFLEYVAPFKFDVDASVRQFSMWGTDTLTDNNKLFDNFGYLLAAPRPTSEMYRAFLRGVAQLFVMGPTLERFESALNSMAGLPVVRDDGEKLISYENGLLASGTDGSFVDSREGRNGTLTTTQFSASDAGFLPDDVGAVVRVRVRNGFQSYVVTNVVSPTTVDIAPSPAVGSTGLYWEYSHMVAKRQFNVGGSGYLFSVADVGAKIYPINPLYDRNKGPFTIQAYLSPTRVLLDSPWGFIDETSVDWQLTRTDTQTIKTSRFSYDVPFGVPVRSELKDSDNFNVLTLKAFETLTEAFRVTDYVEDPTWWHSTTIPKEIVTLARESAGRRSVSTALVPHVIDPLDGAVVGDIGMVVGRDDEGRPGIERSGNAYWMGGSDIVLNFSSDTPVAEVRDQGSYIKINTAGFAGHFKILAVDSAGTTLRLENFPPPEYTGQVPPVLLDVRLNTLLYRRTVAFVMMDRLLKYHAIYMQIDASTPLPPEFVSDAVALVKQAKPGYTYVYLENDTSFVDRVTLSEIFQVGVTMQLTESLVAPNTQLVVSPSNLIHIGDTFVYADESDTLGNTPGTYALTPTLPAGPPTPRFHAVKGWFDLAISVGGSRPVENIHYTFDRVNGTVTLLTTFPASPVFNYVVVILRTRSGVYTPDPGETPVVVGGANPALWENSPASLSGAGLIDRALQITIGP